MGVIVGDKEFFKGIGEIKFEGAKSDNPLAFKYYNPDQVVAGKTMRDHFKFAIAYWHTFCGQGSDPFGPGTQNFAWDKSSDALQAGKDKADAAFEFITKMEASKVKLLWGTSNCFSNPRYMNGAATNPEFNVLARAAGQVKIALDATI